jgi:hypothetical protein
MTILKTLKNFLGITEKLPHDDSYSIFLVKLQKNRDTALRQIIPTRMMNEFQMTIRHVLRLFISTHRFGHRLILHHNIDPEVVVQIMLRESDTKLAEET